mmetsp:Transcript_46311/g.140457  ORF Transcript_46311/g.140457 Transcript_46311/m.140457 type:complete len:254 (-) Transcript_46311:43-804(-)
MKTTTASRHAPGNNSRTKWCENAGTSDVGRPVGMCPIISTPSCLPNAAQIIVDIAITIISLNSTNILARGPRLFKRCMPTNATKMLPLRATVGQCSDRLPNAKSISKGLKLPWQPSAPGNWDSTINKAEPVTKPLRAGRDMKRTTPAIRVAPMTTSTAPTSNARTMAARVRSSSVLNRAISAPVSNATSPPVPTEPWRLVPNNKYTKGATTQLYGPWTRETPESCACATLWAISTQPMVTPPATSAKSCSRHA